MTPDPPRLMATLALDAFVERYGMRVASGRIALPRARLARIVASIKVDVEPWEARLIEAATGIDAGWWR